MKTDVRMCMLGAALALAACGDDPAGDADATGATDTGAGDTGGDAAGETGGTDADDATGSDAEVTAGRTTFGFEPIAVTGTDPVWGAVAVGGFLVGGVDAGQDVRDTIHGAALGAGGAVEAQLVGGLDVARYCQCAMYDAARSELVAIGGRGASFGDATSAVVVDTADGTVTPVDDAGAAEFPVGCAAFFSAAHDKGWVFGGLSSTQRAFTATTHRWDPSDRSFTALAIEGPAARYDAAVHVMLDGDALLVSGMGATAVGVRFFDDMWRFDAATETWSELVPTTEERPPGRRYAWSALAPDESLLVFGYGSDSPMGASVLGDLWTYTFATGVWAPLELDGEVPSARGFAPNWQIPGTDAGVLAFGTDATMRVMSDAWVLRVPDALAGAWH